VRGAVTNSGPSAAIKNGVGKAGSNRARAEGEEKGLWIFRPRRAAGLNYLQHLINLLAVAIIVICTVLAGLVITSPPGRILLQFRTCSTSVMVSSSPGLDDWCLRMQ
jgi:hypothetical protein